MLGRQVGVSDADRFGTRHHDCWFCHQSKQCCPLRRHVLLPVSSYHGDAAANSVFPENILLAGLVRGIGVLVDWLIFLGSKFGAMTM